MRLCVQLLPDDGALIKQHKKEVAAAKTYARRATMVVVSSDKKDEEKKDEDKDDDLTLVSVLTVFSLLPLCCGLHLHNLSIPRHPLGVLFLIVELFFAEVEGCTLFGSTLQGMPATIWSVYHALLHYFLACSCTVFPFRVIYRAFCFQ